MSRRARDLSVVGAGYAVSALAGLAAASQVPAGIPALAVGMGVSALVIFFGSVITGNSSFFDPWWSLAPMAVVLALPQGGGLRDLLARALVLAWGARLTWNWVRGWRGFEHEDWRYVRIRDKVGRLWWWPVSLSGIHLFPAALVALGSLPLLPLAADPRPFDLFDALGLLVMAGAILLEAAADQQLWRHRGTPGVLDRGLWAFCRHPNYLGEIGFWWGLAITARAWPIGAVAITALFLGVSIPLIEERHRSRRPDYAAYQGRVPRLLPRLARRPPMG